MIPVRASGLPRAYLRPCLLLLLAEGPSHGYELLEAVEDLGLRCADAGGLYRALRAMDEAGEVRSWWERSESGPARRTYDITALGRRALDDHIGEAEAVVFLLGGLVDRYRRSAASPAS
jgi:PadR family transcriptional regulator PadR